MLHRGHADTPMFAYVVWATVLMIAAGARVSLRLNFNQLIHDRIDTNLL